jgi:mercuric reductase
MAEQFDLIVIGAGAAARTAAARASDDYGARVAMVDRGGWGGACSLVACKPTKAYLEAARLARDARVLGAKLGTGLGNSLLLSRVKAWKDELVGTPQAWRERYEASGWTTIEGTASFVDRATIRVGERTLTAPRLLLATGSLPAVPAIEGLDEMGWIDSTRALELTDAPESLLVVGAGPVGLELGQFFARIGTRVTIAGRVAPRADADAAAALQASLEAEGIAFEDGPLESVRGRGSTHVLLAAGRIPDLADLELERVGVETSRRGVVVDAHMRSSVPGIWAAGDAAGVYQLTSVADYEGKVAVDDMFTDREPVADYSALPTCIFTDPELGAIGLTEQEARAAGHAVATAVKPAEDVLRAWYTDSTTGLFKLVFDTGSRRVLGIHVVARSAGEIVQGYAPALRLGMTVEDLVDTHYVFPSWGEGVREAADLVTRAVVREA